MAVPTTTVPVPLPGKADHVRELVLTGGPCAGKTTGIAHMAETLRDRGWRVLVAPEVATLVITGGLHDIGQLAANSDVAVPLQSSLLRLQRSLRASMLHLASTLPDDRTVIVYDRAECDFAAYLPDGYFDAVVAHAGLDLTDVRDSYDAVIHMVTAADGAEHAYTLANNQARSETPEQARALDRATVAGWAGHPHLRLVGNHGSFDDKLDELARTAMHLLGDPHPYEIERKFLLAGTPDLAALDRQVGLTRVGIEQVYLQPADGAEVRVRRRTQGRSVTCVRTAKTDVGAGVRAEVERVLSPVEYLDLLRFADPSRAPVIKTRHLFVDGTTRYELDHITSPVDVWLLEVEVADIDDDVPVPDWLGPVTDVTDDPAWRNAAVATRT